MDIIEAADKSVCMFEHDDSFQDRDGRSKAHAVWMLEGIIKGYVQEEQAHRWLGYAQALMVFHNIGTLEDMKAINKAS